MKTTSHPLEPTFKTSPAPRSCTFRAIAVGAIGSLIIGVGTTYNIMVIHGSYMAIDFSAAAAIFVFLRPNLHHQRRRGAREFAVGAHKRGVESGLHDAGGRLRHPDDGLQRATAANHNGAVLLCHA